MNDDDDGAIVAAFLVVALVAGAMGAAITAALFLFWDMI